MAEAGFREPRPKALKVGFNVRADGVKRIGVYYPTKSNDKFKGEIRMRKLGKLWLGRECQLEAMMIRCDTSRKCMGLETLHFDHADYFQSFKYDGVVYNDKTEIIQFLQQAAASLEKRAAFRKFVKGECDRIIDLAVIKSFLNNPESVPRKAEESPMQDWTAQSCSSQPASMACVETHIRSPPVKSLPPLDRNDAVLGSLDGQQVHKKKSQPMPGIGLESFSRSLQIDLCCNDLDMMPMECGDRTGVHTSRPFNYLEFCEEYLLLDNDLSNTD